MLRIIPKVGIQRAKDYFSESLDQQAYYSEGQELAGVWGGALAALLDLSGDVQRQPFHTLCENRHPSTGKPLTPRTCSNRRVGYEFNFNPPKSISIQSTLRPDPAIHEGHEEAVDATMRLVQEDSQTRVRKGGADFDRSTGNLLWGKFTHLTGRPVGGIPDMNTHSHVFVFNATLDLVENQIKAVQVGNIKREAGFYEAYYHSRLRQNMEEAGYPTRTKGRSFELEHVTDEMITTFSRRTRQIEAIAREKGIVDAERKGELGARTREEKAKELTMDQLRPIWRTRLSDEQYALLAGAKGKARSKEWIAEHGHEHAKQAIAFSCSHSFERESVVREKRLLAEALRHAQGNATLEQLTEQLAQLDMVRRQIDGIEYLTTRQMLKEEDKIAEFARAGRGKYAPFSQRSDFSHTPLSPMQSLAARGILASEDQVILMRGVAGSGKTYLMQQVVQEIEQAQRKGVTVAAPTIDSSDLLQREGFSNAQTIQRLLTKKSSHAQLRNATLWIDEAGQLGTRTLGQVFQLAQQQNTRLLLTGDDKQHSSVLRGSPLRLLKESGITPIELTEIRRQKGDYKRIVHKLSEGKYQSAFEELDRRGWVKEMILEEAHQAIAEEVRRNVLGRRSSTASRPMVITPTNQERNELTATIRAELFRHRWLSGEERTIACLESVQLTAAERELPESYHPGQVVCFHQNMKGFKAGSRAAVDQVDKQGNVWLDRPERSKFALNLEQPDRFDVFKKIDRQLAIGDPIQITANGRTKTGNHALRSGSEYEVKGFDSDTNEIVLMNGWTVPKDFGHLDHAYVHTSVASQSQTTDKVLISQRARSLANNAEQFYVSVSRAQQEATIFTDDKEKLAEEIRRTEPLKNATDLERHKDDPFPVERERDERKQNERSREPSF